MEKNNEFDIEILKKYFYNHAPKCKHVKKCPIKVDIPVHITVEEEIPSQFKKGKFYHSITYYTKTEVHHYIKTSSSLIGQDEYWYGNRCGHVECEEEISYKIKGSVYDFDDYHYQSNTQICGTISKLMREWEEIGEHEFEEVMKKGINFLSAKLK